MALLHVAPTIEVESDRIHGCTPWLAQLLVLFSYSRCVTIDRRQQRVWVTTRWLWFWQSKRTIAFDRVSRIIYRAQALPSLSPLRYLALLRSSDVSDSAFFLISIAIKTAAGDRRPTDELSLFTVWQQQPRDGNWLDELAGIKQDPRSTGDECAGAIVELLHEYLSVPIASH
ncbi:MAG: hypothetical protein JWN85_5064 [Gammaproteobacteria bacterium]|nr:hypothetical protein [Gammaproteobacteria bacterium]